VQLVAEKGTRLVGIGEDQLTVHMLRPYSKWEDFRPRIVQAIEAYRDTVNPEGVNRIGLRYINRIAVPEENPELGDYFTIPPKFPAVEPATKVLAFFNRKEVEYIDKPIRIVVTFADWTPNRRRRRRSSSTSTSSGSGKRTRCRWRTPSTSSTK
jgi:uncharacterized protein (TIGR04255 family)